MNILLQGWNKLILNHFKFVGPHSPPKKPQPKTSIEGIRCRCHCFNQCTKYAKKKIAVHAWKEHTKNFQVKMGIVIVQTFIYNDVTVV